MKILMLHNRYLLPGGEDHSTAAEVALLRDHGHEVELLEEDNRRVEQLGKIRTALRTVWSRESHRHVDEKLRAGSFDVMHVQNFFPLWSPSVYYAASRNRVPVIQTLRNYRLMCVNSLLFRDRHICEECVGRAMPWRGVVHACYRESRAASAVVATMIGAHKALSTWQKRVKTYIAVSEFARQKYIAAGFPAEQIMVKPNFIHPTPAPGEGRGGYALYVGRLSPEKGITTMIEAWKAARNPMPLNVVGQGPLTELVQAAALECPAIQYLGGKPFADVLEMMRKADLLVFPSVVYETMGRTIMEAFAVGTPVLASNLGPMAAMVLPEKNGFHFSPGNAAELRQKIEWCSSNLDQLRALRANARAAFEAEYTAEANLRRLLAIYTAALAKQ
jgi:glycosyltransferase involved in cell wall biosynthesis